MIQPHPSHYELVLIPDLEAFTFSGTARLHYEFDSAVEAIVVDAVALDITGCSVGAGAARPVACAVTPLRDAKDRLRIEFPTACPGSAVVTIDYHGTIGDQMAGFYRSPYTLDGTPGHMAVTQFQESDARRAFPCVDHPAAKATFDVTLVVPDSLTAISNMPIARSEPHGAGMKEVAFETTPKMSTYLLFFGVGPFAISEDDSDPRVRAVTLPAAQIHTDFGKEAGRRSIAFCEDWFDIPYPLAKLDLIAVPDFAFGAMENWGAVTFRENLLLNDPATTSRQDQERIAEVVAHEIVHQWFGNLVTPSDWKYLWLNESFATYVSYMVLAHHYSQWGIWEQFQLSQCASALDRDSFADTVPIEMPGGKRIAINVSTAPIIYSKGASILRQVHGWIGEGLFQKGLQHYLREHANGNAGSRDFWEAFEAVSDEPVTDMMKGWVGQPGHPVVRVTPTDTGVRLTQRRFGSDRTDDGLWQIPIRIRSITADGDSHTERLLMTGAELNVPLADPDAAVLVNDGKTGFFRVVYDSPDHLRQLGELARTRAVSDIDRWGLQDDLYAAARFGMADIGTYLDFVAAYADDPDYLPMAGIAGHLQHAALVLASPHVSAVTDRGRHLLGRALGRIGLIPQAEDPHTRSLLRDAISFAAVRFGVDAAVTGLSGAFESLRAGGTVAPDMARAVMQTGAWFGDATVLQWFQDRFATSTSEHERMKLMAAVSAFQDRSVLENALAWAIAHVPDRIRFMVIAGAAANPAAVDWIWSWFVDHIPQLRTGHPLLFERMISSVVPVGGLVDPDQVRSMMAGFAEDHPETADAVALALARLDVNRRFREAVITR